MITSRKIWARQLLVFSCAIMVFAGCSKPLGTSDHRTTEKSNYKNSKILTIGMPTDMLTFDIHNHNSISTEAIHINMFSYLFKRSSDMEIKPDLVESYKVIDDTTWEFKLKKNVTFHSGDPLTAADVKYTLERVAKDKSLREYPNYKQIIEVRMIDNLRFQILTDGPQPALLNRLSSLGSGILPKNYIERNGFDYFLTHPVGSGPFKFVEWVHDDYLTLESYNKFYGGRVKAWDRVVFRKIPDDRSRIIDLLAGGSDIAVNIPPDLVHIINAQEDVTTLTTDNEMSLYGVKKSINFKPRTDEMIYVPEITKKNRK
ncbi:Glutathione-binding protein GsiB [Paenibacillus allorhizoplanae]|uniref:Glutathione-binding protein GsiB n=1 Tax=Paenibacillus allorhizoplanae TaxID=2905648 RepID=A0ABM9BTE9_9BACL|nr:ABC transporter substrate-binding protein [Paenibacillus allorhizoplanae]CAH1193182.1 Glutathione-binding protein GsiB [Paenibacillus allorhizoplanae]